MFNTSHFQGGTITYKVLNTSGSTVSIMITQTYLYRWGLVYCDNSYILSQSSPNSSSFTEYNGTLNCVSNCTTKGGYTPVPVRTYCTDYSSSMAISVTQRTDIVNLTSDAYFRVAFVSSAWRTLSLPKGSPTSKGWSVACLIDLRTRSDTGKPNTPPVATMISPIYIPVGIRQSLNIPTIDGDNDVVRCRFANTANECSNVCPPASLPNNTVLISSNCTLLITGANVTDWYAVAIQVEDFANSTSTTPLSSVPVQFLVNVYASPSCTKASYLYGPYNKTGACESIQVGQPYSMVLYVENYCSSYGVTIKDIATLSFPIVIKTNIVPNTSTLYSVSLTWTPTANQVGTQILCAVAIDSQDVQSNQYCVAFSVSETSTGVCPGETLETTSNNYISTINNVVQNTSVTTVNNNMILSNETSTSNLMMSSAHDDLTTYINEEQSTADDTSSMSTTTIISTTSHSSSNDWPWLLPLIIALASLLLCFCCSCLCCPAPFGFGLLCRKRRRNRSLEPLPNNAMAHRLPRMYMIQRSFKKAFDNISRTNSSLSSPRSTNVSDIHLNLSSSTPRGKMMKKEKNAKWAYPSPRIFEIEISSIKYV